MPRTRQGKLDLANRWKGVLNAMPPGSLNPTYDLWKIPSTVFLPFADQALLAQDLLTKSEGATATDVTREQCREAFVTLEAMMRELHWYFTKPDFGDERLIALGMPIKDTTKTPTPAPTTVPLVVKVTPLSGQQVEIHFKDEHSARSEAIPKGYDGAILNYTWGDEKVEDKHLIKERRLMTKSPFMLKELPLEAERSWLSFFLQWQINADAIEGPRGAVSHVVVT
jgi:hypothetical protein